MIPRLSAAIPRLYECFYHYFLPPAPVHTLVRRFPQGGRGYRSTSVFEPSEVTGNGAATIRGDPTARRIYLPLYSRYFRPTGYVRY